MFLRSLEIRNFRSIRRGRLDFDDTTVLIGENDSGKSSLFDALGLALGPAEDPPRFEAHHFHRNGGEPSAPPVGPIQIRLVFEERQAGEWDGIDRGELNPLLEPRARRRRRLILEIEGQPASASETVAARWNIHSPGSAHRSSDRAALARLRSLNRLLRLRAGSLLDPPPGCQADEALPPLPAELAPLAREIEGHYRALVSGTSRHERSELKAGYEAALEVLAQRAVNGHSAGALAGSLVEEILDRRGLDSGQHLQAFHGSAAQQLGILILTAAILRHFPGRATGGSEFLLLLEDPEAHLHLMTLASVWGLLDQLPAQKIISTQSGVLLAATPLHSLRRLTRQEGYLRQWRVRRNSLKADELRKLSYHIRVRRADANFARCWLLVEGETEFWILPELARLCGYDLALEGVACVEFAQSGLVPLIKMARELGIEWHLLSDGDKAGRVYADTARAFVGDEPEQQRLTNLRQRDIEHCFWKYGYAGVFARAARIAWPADGRVQPRSVINRAIKRHSKPHMAFELIVAAAAKDSPGVPAPLKQMLDTCVQLAREGAAVREPAETGRRRR